MVYELPNDHSTAQVHTVSAKGAYCSLAIAWLSPQYTPLFVPRRVQDPASLLGFDKLRSKAETNGAHQVFYPGRAAMVNASPPFGLKKPFPFRDLDSSDYCLIGHSCLRAAAGPSSDLDAVTTARNTATNQPAGSSCPCPKDPGLFVWNHVITKQEAPSFLLLSTTVDQNPRHSTAPRRGS